ncbi:carnosine N-methyltransferase [Trifolium repens]|nr:carnosine N-methyltransferase [Trifolium repens]
MLDDALMRKLVDEKEFSGDELFNLSHHRFIMFEFTVKEWHGELFNVLAEFNCMTIVMAVKTAKQFLTTVTSSQQQWLDPSFQLNVPLVDVDKMDASMTSD